MFIFYEVANYFVAVRKTSEFKFIVPVVEGLNIINLYVIDNQVTGPEHPIDIVLCAQYEKFEYLSEGSALRF